MNTFTTVPRTLALLAVAALLGAHVATAALAADTSQSLESLVIGLAASTEQHAALANYYRDKAEQSRKEVALHKSMRAAYLNQKPTAAGAMANHCESLIKSAESAAAGYDTLAAEHDNLAKGK